MRRPTTTSGLTDPSAVAPRMQLGGPPPQPARPARPAITWIGRGVIAIGLVLGAVLGLKGFLDHRSDVSDLVRGPLPAPTLLLDAGPQTIFLEGGGLTRTTGDNDGDGVDDGVCADCQRARNETRVVVTTIERTPVPVEEYRSNLTYDDGVAVATVDIPRAGRYVVNVTSPLGERVAVGQLQTTRSLVAVGLGLAAWFVCGATGGWLMSVGRGSPD